MGRRLPMGMGRQDPDMDPTELTPQLASKGE
jgi:hypothetical protein